MSDYAEGYYADDDDQGLDPEVLGEMQEWHAEQEAAYEAARDAKIDELGERWAEEDAAREAAAWEADEDQRNHDEAVRMVAKAAKEAGLEDGDQLEDVWWTANALHADREFRPGLEGPERVRAAIAEAVKAKTPTTDELETAERFMTRRRAARVLSGEAEDGEAEDRLLETWREVAPR